MRCVLFVFATLFAAIVLTNDCSLALQQTEQQESTQETETEYGFPYCPEELAFIHFDVYYYTVINCRTSETEDFLYGYSTPVQTGCLTSPDRCATTESVVATIPAETSSSSASFSLSDIPAAKIDSADKVFLDVTRGNVSHSVNTVQVGTDFYVAVTVQYDGEPRHSFARKVSGSVPAVGTGTINLDGDLVFNLRAFKILP